MEFHLIEKSILVTLMLAAISFFSLELFKKYKIIMKGTGTFSFDRPIVRLKRVFDEFILQKKVLSQRFFPGLMHALVFWGFMAFGAITIDHFLQGFNYPWYVSIS